MTLAQLARHRAGESTAPRHAARKHHEATSRKTGNARVGEMFFASSDSSVRRLFLAKVGARKISSSWSYARHASGRCDDDSIERVHTPPSPSFTSPFPPRGRISATITASRCEGPRSSAREARPDNPTRSCAVSPSTPSRFVPTPAKPLSPTARRRSTPPRLHATAPGVEPTRLNPRRWFDCRRGRPRRRPELETREDRGSSGGMSPRGGNPRGGPG